jgi:predicted transcriptional regulator
MFHAALFK